MTSFSPDWVSAPGETIADVLRERHLTLRELALGLDLDPRELSALLQGRMTITIALARKLKDFLGASVEFWMSRDFQYHQSLSRAKSEAFLSELPVADMIKFGWIGETEQPSQKLAECLDFFGVQDVSQWYETYGAIAGQYAFRTSAAFDSEPGALAAWLRKGEIEASKLNCGLWDANRFEASTIEIRSLTRLKDPKRFLPLLQQICAKNGVAVVIIRPPRGCRASGATRFLSREKALLLLSFRHLSEDHFWFSFFHEAGHLILHGNMTTFVENNDEPETPEEQQANDFAASALIPSDERGNLLRLPLKMTELVRFAHRLGVSPGIVVGQLQHEGRINHNHFNTLKRRYTWDG